MGATLSPLYHPFAAHYLVRRIDLGPVSITKAAIHHVTYSARGVDAVVALAAVEPIRTVVPAYDVGASRGKHYVVAIPGPDVVGVDGASNVIGSWGAGYVFGQRDPACQQHHRQDRGDQY